MFLNCVLLSDDLRIAEICEDAVSVFSVGNLRVLSLENGAVIVRDRDSVVLVGEPDMLA